MTAATTGAGAAAATAPATRPSFTVGHLDDKRLGELSGLVPSPKHPGLLWGHNDSGNPAELWALSRQGHVVATVPVAGAPNVDWEDVALDESGRLYVADTGNNDRRRREVYVYRFDEPDPTNHAAAPIRPTARWTLRYPGQPFDCEALFVRGRWAYVLPKLRNLRPPTLYRFPLDAPPDRPVTLEAVGVMKAVTGPVTGADVSPDGRWLAVLTVLGPYVFKIDGDPLRAVQAPAAAGHATFIAPRMEAVCFVPEGLLAGTEEGDLYLFGWDDLGDEAAEVKKGASGATTLTPGPSAGSGSDQIAAPDSQPRVRLARSKQPGRTPPPTRSPTRSRHQ